MISMTQLFGSKPLGCVITSLPQSDDSRARGCECLERESGDGYLHQTVWASVG